MDNFYKSHTVGILVGIIICMLMYYLIEKHTQKLDNIIYNMNYMSGAIDEISTSVQGMEDTMQQWELY